LDIDTHVQVIDHKSGRKILLLCFFYAYLLMITRPISFLIVERVSNFGHQEGLTGISRSVFLSSSILYDFLLYLLNFLVFLCASL
ncbi:hypothetical protein PMAYCL1PPCAC_17672, partial [Pristionchus mayeri]